MDVVKMTDKPPLKYGLLIVITGFIMITIKLMVNLIVNTGILYYLSLNYWYILVFSIIVRV